nr:SWI/SNF chromatin-remodeling complex subunit SNF5-like isoform X1 [Aedes albopictus]
MWWVFHVLWLILVIGLFFLILRRIYHFGMQGTEQQYETRTSQDIRSNQQYYIFTIYESQQNARNQQATDPPPPNYEAPPPPPKYDDVIKSPDLYQKPPSYNQVQ